MSWDSHFKNVTRQMYMSVSTTCSESYKDGSSTAWNWRTYHQQALIGWLLWIHTTLRYSMQWSTENLTRACISSVKPQGTLSPWGIPAEMGKFSWNIFKRFMLSVWELTTSKMPAISEKKDRRADWNTILRSHFSPSQERTQEKSSESVPQSITEC